MIISDGIRNDYIGGMLSRRASLAVAASMVTGAVGVVGVTSALASDK